MTLIKAAVFDLDGTLLDTIEDLADSANVALGLYGLPSLGYREYMKIVGYGVRNLCETALALSLRRREDSTISGESGSNKPDPDVEKIVEQFNQHYQKNKNNKTKPYDGVMDVLLNMQKNGVKLAVLSNKPDSFTKELIRLHFPTIEFTHIMGASADFPKKPDPAALNHIMKQLGVPSSQTVLFGDGETDMETANAANVLPIGVLWGFRDRETLLEAGAKVLIDKPEEMNAIIAGTVSHEKE